MSDNKPVSVNFSLDPNKTPMLYVDSYLIANNDDMVFFNFAQVAPDPAQHNIVTRVALSKKQAKEFLERLSDHMEKFEV